VAEAGRPAYYAARPGRWRDWWTLLHPPYTAWHLSYVVIGAALAPRVSVSHLLYAVGAFFLAVGVAAHALDELHSRPLRTAIPGWALIAATAISLTGAIGLGVYGITQAGWILLPFMVAGPVLVVAYNAELFGGIIHNDLGFAAAWGAFPALTGYAAQDGTLGLAAVAGAAAALALSAAQRRLSTPARSIRRHAIRVDGTITLADGTITPIGPELILAPLEGALRAMSWGLILLATALAITRLG
jgi:voltage-gated potassium channel Kch